MTTPVARTQDVPELEGDALKAVKHRGSHLQIVASAGSGKTEVVSQRVASLLADGVPPAGIVAFTFTERAAESLRTRIEARVEHRLGPEALDSLGACFIGTIHSYCFRLLQEYVSKYEAYDILDEHRLTALLSRESTRLKLKTLTGRLFDSITAFTRNLDVVENELIPHEKLDGTFGEMARDFYARLEEYRYLTYGQVISRTVQELEKKEVWDRVHGPLQHLIVDEYQDINPAQERLISLLAGPPVELCVVGDDQQAVYQWRGSDVQGIIGFKDRYPGVKKFSIATNRRSRPQIVKAANRFAATIPHRLSGDMAWHREPGEPEVTLWEAATESEEAEQIADAIAALHNQGFRYRDVAILVRGSASYPRLMAALDERRIPVQPAGRTALFRQPEAQVFGMLCAFLAGYDWRSQPYGSGIPVTLEGLVADHTQTFGLSPAAAARVEKGLAAWRQQVQEPTGPANLIRDYYALLAECGVPRWDPDDPVQNARLGTLARCSAILTDYESVRRRSRPDPKSPGEIHGGQDRGEWYYRWLAIHVQNWAMGAYEAFDGEDNVTVDAVDVTTVHQAKGLEWPAVFVPCMTAKRFPSSKTGSTQNWLVPRNLFNAARYEGSEVDERRLFYVAITRARDWLSVSYHNAVTKAKTGASPFIHALDLAFDSGGCPLPPAPKHTDESTEPLSLTFSDLAAYEACGLAYRMRKLLGFEAPLAVELGYGKAVHHVMREVAQRARDTGELPTSAVLDALLDASFYLPAASKPAHAQLKAAARRLVDRYIDGHGEDLQRVRYMERPFQLHLGTAIISGRADVILEEVAGSERLTIVDYKTSADPEADHALQLQVYADAGRREGLDVRAAYVHDLKEGTRSAAPVAPYDIQRAEVKVLQLVDGLRERRFNPSPGARCKRCDIRAICRFKPAAAAG